MATGTNQRSLARNARSVSGRTLAIKSGKRKADRSMLSPHPIYGYESILRSCLSRKDGTMKEPNLNRTQCCLTNPIPQKAKRSHNYSNRQTSTNSSAKIN